MESEWDVSEADYEAWQATRRRMDAIERQKLNDRLAYEQARYFGNGEKCIYPSVRQSVLKRAGYQCERCGRYQPGIPLDMHHLRYVDGNGQSIRQRETPDDLQAVCRECHKLIHGH